MDPAKMKVVDLRSELGALGLDTKGNKPALVERLKKALESVTGNVLPDTSIMDTSTEDADESPTPRRAGPASRTTRRSSSSRAISTPAKRSRFEKNVIEEESTPEIISDSSQSPEPEQPKVEEPKPKEPEPEKPKPKEPEPEKPNAEKPLPKTPEHVQPPQPVSAPVMEVDLESEEESKSVEGPAKSDIYSIDDGSQSPVPVDDSEKSEAKVMEQKDGNDEEKKVEDGEESKPVAEDGEPPKPRELTEEEEWEQLDERLKIREKERLERERLQAENDKKKLEEVKDNPIKLQRLKRKFEKKHRWSNFYKAVEVTNKVLTPPVQNPRKKKVQQEVPKGFVEPELDDDKITISWYDSDLNQYLELPDLVSVLPCADGAFGLAWAGARASHGVARGRVCYEVRIGSVVTTTESMEKDAMTTGIRVGWSTDDCTLHLGENELSWGYESTGRAVNNGEYKEYGQKLEEKDVIGAYVDLESSPCKMFYTVNGVEQGTAFEFDKSLLNGKTLYPHVLTKNLCYRVNMGYDRYNMITRTNIVRNRVEVPIEEVLEERRRIEEEIQRAKAEAIRKAKERRDKEKKEREEKQRKKKEEREKHERERKEKEAKERKERGEEDPVEEKEKENGDKPDETMENGDKSEEVVEVKSEPMETDAAEPKDGAKDNEEVKDKEDIKEKEDDKEKEEVKDKEDAKDKEAEVKPEPEGEVKEMTEEQVLQGHTLDKRIKFVIRYTVSEELSGTEACLVPGYIFINAAELLPGPRRPNTLAECEVILMVGMPGSGKTYWAKQHIAANPHKRYNILSTGALFDRMKVDCKPYKSTYEGRWDAMVSKCAKCVLKLLEIAKGRRRNYILDQTNVYQSAQRRKLREFDGYRRIAQVIVTDEETYKERQKQREEMDGKEVPDGAIMDMKANFSLPEKCAYLDEVQFAELQEEEAKKVVEGFLKEAKAAGVMREREKRDRSASRDGPMHKKNRPDDRRGGPRDDRRGPRDFNRDREDRWGGGGGGVGGGGRWGPPPRGGSRWAPGGPPGGRDARPPPPRQDRWGPPPPNNRGGGEFPRERDGFRMQRGGAARGRGGGGGGGAPHDAPRYNSRDRPDNRHMPPPPHAMDKRPADPPNPTNPTPLAAAQFKTAQTFSVAISVPPGGGAAMANAGSWQRGGGPGAARGGQSQSMQQRGPQRPMGKDGNQQNTAAAGAGWNQWAGGWGGWGNWGNQNQANWNNWGNWGNWPQGGNQQQQQQGNQQQTASQQQQVKGNQQQAGANQQQAGANQQQQWPANYTAQQWYQWQQWQQQQQGWPGYGQQSGAAAGSAATPDAAAWAQYYQNYGNAANAANATNTVATQDKK